MINDNKKYSTDIEKANLFAETLAEIYSDNDNKKFDDTFKNETNEEIDSFIKSWKPDTKNSDYVNIRNLNKIIKSLKSSLSYGED